MGWMPHSIVKSGILLELDRLNEDPKGRSDFRAALDAVYNNSATLETIFRPKSEVSYGLHDWADWSPETINKTPLDFDQDHVDHIRDSWFKLTPNEEDNQPWDGQQANNIFLLGLRPAAEAALNKSLPLDITWICSKRAVDDPEIMVIETKNHISVLLSTRSRWWKVRDMPKSMQPKSKRDDEEAKDDDSLSHFDKGDLPYS